METRKNVFNLLLTDSEVAKLELEAKNHGVSKADILRSYFTASDSIKKEIDTQKIAEEISRNVLEFLDSQNLNSMIQDLQKENRFYIYQLQEFLKCYNAETDYFDYQKGAQVAKDLLAKLRTSDDSTL